MDILDFPELDPATEGFNIKEGLLALKETVMNFVKSKLDALMTLKRKIGAKFSKKIFMEKRSAEDLEEIVNATYESIDSIEEIANDINANKSGVVITSESLTIQEIAAQINQNTNSAKNIIQDDANFVESCKNQDPTCRKRTTLKEFTCTSIKKLIDKLSGCITKFGNHVEKFFNRCSPNSDEVEAQQKPKMIMHIMKSLAMAVGIITLLKEFVVSVAGR